MIKLPRNFNFNIPKINEKNRNWVLGGFMLFIFLADYFLIMQPFQIGPLTKLNPKIQAKSRDLRTARSDIKNVQKYREEVAQLNKEMQEVEMRILSKEEIPKILDNISRLAINSNIRINQIMPLRDSKAFVLENDEGKYYALSILVSARGGYHDLGHFLNYLETDQIFMDVTDFDIASSADDSLNHSIKMTIRAFILQKAEENKSQ